MAESVESGCVTEEVEVQVGDRGMMVDARFKERDQVLRGEGGFKMLFDDMGQLVELGFGGRN